ncbi:MAG: adenylylsulfate reductase, partial [Ruminiclostridium sp.]
YPKDCWGCTSCIKECAVHAISFYLGADIGGTGSRTHTEKKEGLLRWVIEKPDGEITDIFINPKESNKY